MKIGPYRAHFTGYQPQLRASQEFCEDIPNVAKAIIVLDFINEPLREMAIEFRLVHDVNNVGVNATIDDLGSAEDIERASMFVQPAARYPQGSVDVSLEFTEPGQFIGMVTANDDRSAAERTYVAVFPIFGRPNKLVGAPQVDRRHRLPWCGAVPMV